MIERLAFLCDEILTSQSQEEQRAARPVVGDLAAMASAIPGLDSLWEELAPLLQRALP
jgi:hypothetical protein